VAGVATAGGAGLGEVRGRAALIRRQRRNDCSSGAADRRGGPRPTASGGAAVGRLPPFGLASDVVRRSLRSQGSWLQVTTGGSPSTAFGKWLVAGSAVPQSSVAWNVDLNTEGRSGLEPGGNYIHQLFDEYNNTGKIDGTLYAFDGDTCRYDTLCLQYCAIVKTAEDQLLI
jgi:hypothetical protein